MILGSNGGDVLVMCGPHSIMWPEVCEASHCITTTGWLEHLNHLLTQHEEAKEGTLRCSPFHRFPAIIRAISTDLEPGNGSWTVPLLKALIRSRKFNATHPEDKVFSLLGLVQNHVWVKPRLSPTYRSVSETYTNVAIRILVESRGDLLLLSCIEGEKSQPEKGLRSWVPDWRCSKQTGLLKTDYERYWVSKQFMQKEPFVIQGIQR